MARASAKRAKRARSNARRAQQAVAPEPVAAAERAAPPEPEPKAEKAPERKAQALEKRRFFNREPRKQAPKRPEDTMFFTRLRTHAKWVFVLLAVAFAIGFLAFGVGAGGTGVGDAIRDFFGGGSGTKSLADAVNDVEKNPTDRTAVLGLANQYQNRGQYEQAAKTLESYTKLRPDDAEALATLAQVRDTQARLANVRSSEIGNQGSAFGQTIFLFPQGSGFLGAVGANPIQDAVSGRNQQEAQQAGLEARGFYRDEIVVLKKVAELKPQDAQTQLQLGQAALAASDNETATLAFEKFLDLSPDDPLAPAVKEQLNQLGELEQQNAQGVEATR